MFPIFRQKLHPSRQQPGKNDAFTFDFVEIRPDSIFNIVIGCSTIRPGIPLVLARDLWGEFAEHIPDVGISCVRECVRVCLYLLYTFLRLPYTTNRPTRGESESKLIIPSRSGKFRLQAAEESFSNKITLPWSGRLPPSLTCKH